MGYAGGFLFTSSWAAISAALRYTLPPMEKQLTRTAQNATAIALSTVLSNGFQFGWVILLARLLNPADYGTWGTISALIVTAAAIPEFGMGIIVLRDVAQRPADAGRYLSATLVAQPLLALLAYLGLIGLALLLPNDAATRLLVAFASLSLIINVFGNMCYNQLLAVEQMVATSVIIVLHIVFQIVFSFVALASGGGLIGLYSATILAGLLRVAMFWAVMRRLEIGPVWPMDGRIVRALFIDGFPIALSSFLNLAYQHANKVFVFTLLTPTDAGYLTAAFTIVFGVVELINVTVLTALFPAMSRLSQSQPQALRTLTDRLAFLTLIITLPLGIGISMLAAKLAALLFPGFVGTAVVLQALIWHAVLMMVGNFYVRLLIIQNKQRRMVGSLSVAGRRAGAAAARAPPRCGYAAQPGAACAWRGGRRSGNGGCDLCAPGGQPVCSRVGGMRRLWGWHCHPADCAPGRLAAAAKRPERTAHRRPDHPPADFPGPETLLTADQVNQPRHPVIVGVVGIDVCLRRLRDLLAFGVVREIVRDQLA